MASYRAHVQTSRGSHLCGNGVSLPLTFSLIRDKVQTFLPRARAQNNFTQSGNARRRHPVAHTARSSRQNDPWTTESGNLGTNSGSSSPPDKVPSRKPVEESPRSAAVVGAGGSGGSSGSGGGSANLLAELRARAVAPDYVNVFGKPLTKSELSALDVAVQHLTGDSAAAAGGRKALRAHIRTLLLDRLVPDPASQSVGDGLHAPSESVSGSICGWAQEAAVHKQIPLPLVEGAMVLLEVLTQGAPPGEDDDDDLVLVARRRWQLVVGADVGAVQYIPAVEELQVAPDGESFTLGTDLDFLFTGFRGPCKLLAPGHLSYDVRYVRLEVRPPKGWRRAAAWLAWRLRLGSAAPAAAAAGDEPDWSDSLPWSETCREDPSAPAVLLPLPFFPSNEILAFSCDGEVAATRSKLTGGLILLMEVRTRERLRSPKGLSLSGRRAVKA